MIRRICIIAALAAFSLTALPVIGTQSGAEGWSAEARHSARHKRHHARRDVKKRGKYSYQYVPTSHGRTGAWR